MTSRGPQTENDRGGVRPPFVVILFILFGLLVLVGMGQWDWVVAGVIGVVLGIGILGLFRK